MFDLTDWQLSSLSPTMHGVNLIVRVGGGPLHFEFKNKSSGATVPFDALGYTVAGTLPVWSSAVRPWVSTVTSGRVLTTPSAHQPFNIDQIRNNFGIIWAYDIASALGVMAFSYTPLVPPFIHPFLGAFVFATCVFALPTALASSLAAGYITFSYIR